MNKINSKDDNFQALKSIVDRKELTEITTAAKVDTSDVNFGVQTFFQRTRAEQWERDISEYLKSHPQETKSQAERLIKTNENPSDILGFYGWTLTPSKSPSGNLRIVITDQTGDAAKVSEEDAVTTMGHELYGHGLPFKQGKPWEHGKVNEKVFEEIENRTKKNFNS